MQTCKKCGATWHWKPHTTIHPMDHTKPNGRDCSEAKTYFMSNVYTIKEAKKAYKRWAKRLKA